MKALFTKLFCVAAFLFTLQISQAQDIRVTINAPDGLAGGVADVGQKGVGGWGFYLQPGESLTGDIAWVRSIESDSLGCDSLSNAIDIAGNIALVRRGACFFSDKVWHAQQAGATGVIICNANPGEGTITMGAGGDFAALDTIPAVMLSFEDCELLAAAIEDGETINVTMDVPGFFGPITSYSYHTPVSQVIPMDAMEVKIVNTTDATADITVTATITDPDLLVTELTEVTTLDPGVTDTVGFEPYLPTVPGTYTAEFSNDLTADVLTQNFVITDYTWATDLNDNFRGVAPAEDQFVTAGLIYHTGSLAINNDVETVATYASFGVDNPADVISGDPNADVFTFILYDGDADMDNVLDIANSFDDLLPIATGTFVLTEDYEAGSIVSVELESFTGDPITLAPNGAYFISVLYDGVNAGLGIPPSLVSTPTIDYPINITTPLFLDQLFSGWAGSINVVRLHIEGFEPTTSVEELLEDYKVSLSPNPATDVVRVNFDLDEVADDVQLNIYNFDGKVVRSERLGGIISNTVEFNVSELPAGTYFMSILTPEGYTSRKFVVVGK